MLDQNWIEIFDLRDMGKFSINLTGGEESVNSDLKGNNTSFEMNQYFKLVRITIKTDEKINAANSDGELALTSTYDVRVTDINADEIFDEIYIDLDAEDGF